MWARTKLRPCMPGAPRRFLRFTTSGESVFNQAISVQETKPSTSLVATGNIASLFARPPQQIGQPALSVVARFPSTRSSGRRLHSGDLLSIGETDNHRGQKKPCLRTEEAEKEDARGIPAARALDRWVCNAYGMAAHGGRAYVLNAPTFVSISVGGVRLKNPLDDKSTHRARPGAVESASNTATFAAAARSLSLPPEKINLVI